MKKRSSCSRELNGKTHRLIAVRRKSIRPRSDQSDRNHELVMILERHHRDVTVYMKTKISYLARSS